MIEKYRLTYKDIDGMPFTISVFDVENEYVGDPLVLTGGEEPCVITMKGDEDNMLDPIRTGSATVNILVNGDNPRQLITDLSTIGERRFWCTIESTNLKWSGWVTPNQAVRTFGEFGYELQMEVKDPFSSIKGLTLQDENGQLIYGVMALRDFVANSLRVSEAPADQPTVYVNGATTEYGGDIWQFMGIDADTFNDNSGRPLNGYEIITRIMKSTGSFIYRYNKGYRVVNPVFLDKNTFKTLYIKSITQNKNFLIQDDEQITMIRSSKEVSLEVDFQDQTGYLKNAFFNGWDGTDLLEWTHTQGGNVVQKGNGRKYAPYSVELSSSTAGEYARIEQQADETFQKGSIITYTIKMAYFDYVNGDPTDDPINYPSPRPGIGHGYNVILPLMLKLVGTDGNTYYSIARIFSNDYTDTKNPVEIGWVKSGDLASSPFNADYDQGFVGLAIGLDSTRNIQDLTITMPKLPSSGTITAYIQAALLYDFNGSPLNPEWINRTNSHLDYTPVTILSALLTEKVEKSYNGLARYLTQNGDSTQIKETETVNIDTSIPANVSGATYLAEDNNGVEKGEKIYYVLVDGEEYQLSEYVIRCMMYYERNARDKIEFSFKSNEILFDDLLKFEWKEGIFMQLTNTYYTKKAEQKCLAVELKGSFKDFIQNADPDETHDLYEVYNIS